MGKIIKPGQGMPDRLGPCNALTGDGRPCGNDTGRYTPANTPTLKVALAKGLGFAGEVLCSSHRKAIEKGNDINGNSDLLGQ